MMSSNKLQLPSQSDPSNRYYDIGPRGERIDPFTDLLRGLSYRRQYLKNHPYEYLDPCSLEFSPEEFHRPRGSRLASPPVQSSCSRNKLHSHLRVNPFLDSAPICKAEDEQNLLKRKRSFTSGPFKQRRTNDYSTTEDETISPSAPKRQHMTFPRRHHLELLPATNEAWPTDRYEADEWMPDRERSASPQNTSSALDEEILAHRLWERSRRTPEHTEPLVLRSSVRGGKRTEFVRWNGDWAKRFNGGEPMRRGV